MNRDFRFAGISVTSVPYMEKGMWIGITTEWQLRAELDTWPPVETSRRTPHFHVTSIKCVIKYD